MSITEIENTDRSCKNRPRRVNNVFTFSCFLEQSREQVPFDGEIFFREKTEPRIFGIWPVGYSVASSDSSGPSSVPLSKIVKGVYLTIQREGQFIPLFQ